MDRRSFLKIFGGFSLASIFLPSFILNLFSKPTPKIWLPPPGYQASLNTPYANKAKVAWKMYFGSGIIDDKRIINGPPKEWKSYGPSYPISRDEDMKLI